VLEVNHWAVSKPWTFQSAVLAYLVK